METDYFFRSNTLNPALEDNYLENKWKELTEKFNAIGQGPSLSMHEWIKVGKIITFVHDMIGYIYLFITLH